MFGKLLIECHWNWGEHQENVKRSISYIHTSQTLQLTSPVLLSTSRYLQAPLQLSKELSDTASPFSGASESSCSNGGEFRMLWYLTCKIVKYWSTGSLYADLWMTLGAAETATQLCGRLGAVNLQDWFHVYNKNKAFRRTDLSLLQSQDSLSHNTACII